MDASSVEACRQQKGGKGGRDVKDNCRVCSLVDWINDDAIKSKRQPQKGPTCWERKEKGVR